MTTTTSAPPTIKAGIEKAIDHAARSIAGYISLGWSKERAISLVRESSTLGPQSWAQVLAKI